MKIAFISYEFPPDTSGGGIGTYTQQVSALLAKRGHQVFVFCGTMLENYHEISKQICICRIHAASVAEFRDKILPVFIQWHTQENFEVVESPEYGADGYNVKKYFPSLPYLVKLHSPTYLITAFNNYYEQYIFPGAYWNRLKRFVKTVLGGGKSRKYQYQDDVEYLNVRLADVVASPSTRLARRIARDWNFPFKNMVVLPNPYIPHPDLEGILPVYNYNRVTFIGKLSILKGILDLAKAIPAILKKHPSTQFRIIGEDSYSPVPGKTMQEYILSQLTSENHSIEFTGKIPLSAIPAYLAETDIVVCTSLWENYPTVLLEAMSAGRIVIATEVGGIPEIITHGENGLLVKAKQAGKLAEAINWCLSHRTEAATLAKNARTFAQARFRDATLSQQIEESYQRTIQQCRR